MKRMAVANRSGENSPPPPPQSQSPKIMNVDSSHNYTNNTINNNSPSSSSSPSSPRGGSGLFSNRGKSVICMSLSLAIHLGGYELSRSTVMALFTSDKLGFGHGKEGGLSALPMAVGCVSPFSVALLWFYASTLDRGGPSYALRTHTLICAGTQIVSGWVLNSFNDYVQIMDDDGVPSSVQQSDHVIFGNDVKSWSRPLLFILFVFQNAYVQLLYNQHWAFISTVLTAEEGLRLFAPIAGLGSIGSTLAAGLVSVFVERMGLIGLLHLAGASYIVSALLADAAFEMARVGGFAPNKYNKKEEDTEDVTTRENSMPLASAISTPTQSATSKGVYTAVEQSAKSPSTSVKYNNGNMFQQANALFQRVPVLGALFLEVVVSQCLSSLVNFIYLYKLKSTITDDSQRAGWSGNFYAWINGISGVFQFFAIPILLRHCEAHRIWIFMPSLMLCCTMYTWATHSSNGLFGASASFFAIKTMEYSLRVAANESLYVSLDYESRYLGKKVISLGAGKFGKSIMAVALSLVMVIYGERKDVNIMWYLSATATLFTFLWLFTSMRLHSLVEADN